MITPDGHAPRIYTAAALIVGDEILSGRVVDANLVQLTQFLARQGIDLKEARFVRDEAATITGAVDALRATHDYLFTMGGMGPTHDDITVECVAAALGLELEENQELADAVRMHWGVELTDARRRLILVPAGAALIGDPKVSPVGLHVENVYILAGLPQVARRSLEYLEGKIAGGSVVQSRSLRISAADESQLAAPLRRCSERWPHLDFGSYPFFRDGVFGCDLVARGRDVEGLDAAMAELRAALIAAGIAEASLSLPEG